jgi:DNA polymerase sigma
LPSGYLHHNTNERIGEGLHVGERTCGAYVDPLDCHIAISDAAVDGMERVVCVPNAKVPIVKIWDPELQLACDMNVNNTLALENTRMIKTYVDIDDRVRPLAMIVKYWTKRRILNDAGRF